MNTKLFCRSHRMKTLLFRTWRRQGSGAAGAAGAARADATVDRTDFFLSKSDTLMTFWDKEGIFKVAHSLNHIRVPFIREGLAGVAPGDKFSTCLKGKKILDVGCGAGVLSEALAECGAEVTGVDANAQLVSLAQRHGRTNARLTHNLPTYLHTSVEEHSGEFEDFYDAVVISEVLEHAQHVEQLLQWCARAARPGGKLFITTPTRTRAAQLYMIYGFENVLKIYPKGSHDYNKFLRPHELQYMLEMNDCRVASVRGYVYRPLAAYWHWTSSTWFSFATEAVKVA